MPDEEGQDMVEYALLAALIAISANAVIVLVGPEIKTLFQDVINGLRSTQEGGLEAALSTG